MEKKSCCPSPAPSLCLFEIVPLPNQQLFRTNDNSQRNPGNFPASSKMFQQHFFKNQQLISILWQNTRRNQLLCPKKIFEV